jgi:hypothetical protein
MTAPLARARTAEAAIVDEKCMMKESGDSFKEWKVKTGRRMNVLGVALKGVEDGKEKQKQKQKQKYPGPRLFDRLENCRSDSEIRHRT